MHVVMAIGLRRTNAMMQRYMSSCRIEEWKKELMSSLMEKIREEEAA